MNRSPHFGVKTQKPAHRPGMRDYRGHQVHDADLRRPQRGFEIVGQGRGLVRHARVHDGQMRVGAAGSFSQDQFLDRASARFLVRSFSNWSMRPSVKVRIGLICRMLPSSAWAPPMRPPR